VVLAVAAAAVVPSRLRCAKPPADPGFVGAQSWGLCREIFDRLRAASLCRLAMQPETAGPVRWELPGPLVRLAAAARERAVPPEARDALLAATRDDLRLVRLQATGASAGCSAKPPRDKDRPGFESADGEREASLASRQDDWSNHCHSGNLHTRRKHCREAVRSSREGAPSILLTDPRVLVILH